MTKKEELLLVAQNKVREGGYNNFSFRELAKDIGIKSASVHYHFPTKADLGAALAKQYTTDFLNRLGDAQSLIGIGEDPIHVFVTQFKQALHQDKNMCLCGLLGAEAHILPELVRIEVKHFFMKNLAWLEGAYLSNGNCSKAESKKMAIKTMSVLEGAMMLSVAVEDYSVFDCAVEGVY